MFRKYTLILFFSLSYCLFTSCDDNSKTTYYEDSSGPINLVTVFSDKDIYADIQKGLNDSLLFGKTFPGLYYPAESMFGVRQFDLDLKNRFKTTRLMLEVEKGEPEITLEKNKFAKPQGYVKVSGNSDEEILNLLRQNQDTIIKLYRWADRQFILSDYKGKAHSDKSALKNLGVEILIPKDFSVVEQQDNFIWYRKDNFNTIHNRDERDGGIVTDRSQDILNILLFKVPFAKNELTQKDAYTIFDSITRLYTKGAKEPQETYIPAENKNDSIKVLVSDYIQVETHPALREFYDFEKLSTNPNQTTYETQGWWSMTLSQLGGPFTAKIILDKKNKMLYVADAIMFAPLNQGVSKKRDYITAMESLFTTFKLQE